jgi:hypothetical protein
LDSGDDKTIKNLSKQFSLIVLDQNTENKGVLEYGAMYEECVDTRMETIFPKVIKYVDSKNPPTAELIFSRVSIFKQEGETRKPEHHRYKLLNQNLEQVFNSADEDTRSFNFL